MGWQDTRAGAWSWQLTIFTSAKAKSELGRGAPALSKGEKKGATREERGSLREWEKNIRFGRFDVLPRAAMKKSVTSRRLLARRGQEVETHRLQAKCRDNFGLALVVGRCCRDVWSLLLVSQYVPVSCATKRGCRCLPLPSSSDSAHVQPPRRDKVEDEDWKAFCSV